MEELCALLYDIHKTLIVLYCMPLYFIARIIEEQNNLLYYSLRRQTTLDLERLKI